VLRSRKRGGDFVGRSFDEDFRAGNVLAGGKMVLEKRWKSF
jgi:hypothetical protein